MDEKNKKNTEEKIKKLQIEMQDKDKCKKFAKKLTDYINAPKK